MDNLIIILEIIMINIVLSGDNAVVIAMASQHLPEKQRQAAVWWGAFGAVALRIVLTVTAVALLDIPYIQLAGALMLLYIAVKLLNDDSRHGNVKRASTLGSAVWTIIVADFVMSLDNVLAVAAIADGNWILLAIGILISIPLIIWGSTFVMKLLQDYPVLVYIGAGILGFTAGEMVVEDERTADWLAGLPALHWALPFLAAAAVVSIGFWKIRMVR